MGATRVVSIGAYPGRTEIRMPDEGPVAIYANGGDSGLTGVYLGKEAPPEGWRIGQGLDEDDLRRAAERLKGDFSAIKLKRIWGRDSHENP